MAPPLAAWKIAHILVILVNGPVYSKSHFPSFHNQRPEKGKSVLLLPVLAMLFTGSFYWKPSLYDVTKSWCYRSKVRANTSSQVLASLSPLENTEDPNGSGWKL